jgi:hypothetical protein
LQIGVNWYKISLHLIRKWQTLREQGAQSYGSKYLDRQAAEDRFFFNELIRPG